MTQKALALKIGRECLAKKAQCEGRVTVFRLTLNNTC